jgi:hypothetical protein
MISQGDKDQAVQVKKGFRSQTLLCRYTADEKPNDYWCRFDLAEAMLFSSDKIKEIKQLFSATVSMVPKHHRKFDLETIAGPLRDYKIANVVSGNRLNGVDFFIGELRKASI